MTQWLSGAPRQDGILAPGDEELRMIPRWSMVLALLLFAGMQYVFHGVMPHHKHELLPMRLMMGYAWGSLVASYALLLGYVSRDVKRRGMSASLWMLVCVVLPGGIGAVVYFLLRQPVLSRCPNCADRVHLSLLPAVPVPDGAGVRRVPSWREDHRCLLHALRP
jgi:MFS family permease